MDGTPISGNLHVAFLCTQQAYNLLIVDDVFFATRVTKEIFAACNFHCSLGLFKACIALQLAMMAH